MKFNKIVCSLFIFIFATTGIFNIPVVAENTNSLIMTYIEDSSAFNEWAQRENSSNVWLMPGAEYLNGMMHTQTCARLTINYVSNGSLLWLSQCGFTTNPRLDISSINSFFRMKILIDEYDTELNFFIQDENGEKSYIPVTNYMQSTDFGKWSQVEIPVLDFYDCNLKLDRSVISIFGVAWKRSSATDKTNVTDLKVLSMPTLNIQLDRIDNNKAKIVWDREENCEKYNIYKNDTLVAQTTDLFYLDEEFDVNLFESYQVSFLDSYGNESMKSNKVKNEFLSENQPNVFMSVFLTATTYGMPYSL